MIQKIMEVGSSIQNGRTIQDVAIKLAEESGEVMGVVSTITGLSSYKKVGDMDLCDELADTLINIVDLGRLAYGVNFPELLKESVTRKCEKWKEKYSK